MNGLATAAFFAFGSLLVLFGSNAPDIIDSLGLDYADFGLVASVLSMGIGFGILSAGPLIDRFPRRPLFGVSCGSVAFASFFLGPETTYSTLLGVSFSIGFGAGFYETVLNTVIVEEAGDLAPRRLLFIHSAATLGASVTPFAIGWLREPLALDWYDSFRAAGFLHLMLLGGLPQLPIARRVEIGSAVEAEPWTANGRLLIAAICLATFAYVGIESALTFFIADYAATELGLASARASGVVGFFWIGLLIGRLGVGLAPRKPSAGTTALLALLASAVLAAFFLGLDLPPEVAMILSGLFLGGVFPIMIGMAGISRPGGAGTAVGLAAGLGSIGGFAIPWLTGVLATRISLGAALITLCLWLWILVFACGVIHRRQSL